MNPADAPEVQPPVPSLRERLRQIADDPSASPSSRRLAGFLLVDVERSGEEHTRRLPHEAEALRALGLE